MISSSPIQAAVDRAGDRHRYGPYTSSAEGEHTGIADLAPRAGGLQEAHYGHEHGDDSR